MLIDTYLNGSTEQRLIADIRNAVEVARQYKPKNWRDDSVSAKYREKIVKFLQETRHIPNPEEDE